jgi:guanosine-3',5'-bis(diphosphate) 3'-pyrophosphohydrolase
MKKGQLLGNVLVLATNAHAGQFDRGGNPYILHPMKVMHYLKSDDEELQCMALLHDVVEDTKTTWDDLVAVGCTERVINGVKALTKMPGESYDQYKERVFANADAMKVKMADLRHNTDIRRLKGVTEKDIIRMEKYNRFYLELQAKV